MLPSGTELQLAGTLRAAAAAGTGTPRCACCYPGFALAAPLRRRRASRSWSWTARSRLHVDRLRALRRLARSGRFDVVHTSLWGAGAFGRAGAGRPAATGGGDVRAPGRGLPAAPAARCSTARWRAVTDEWIGNSRDVCDFIVRAHGAPPGRVHLVRNGVDTDGVPTGDGGARGTAGRPARRGSARWAGWCTRRASTCSLDALPLVLRERDVEVVDRRRGRAARGPGAPGRRAAGDVPRRASPARGAWPSSCAGWTCSCCRRATRGCRTPCSRRWPAGCRWWPPTSPGMVEAAGDAAPAGPARGPARAGRRDRRRRWPTPPRRPPPPARSFDDVAAEHLAGVRGGRRPRRCRPGVGADRVHVVVTGCAGFIGSHLAEAALAAGHTVLGIDCLTAVLRRRRQEARAPRPARSRSPGSRSPTADLRTAELAPLLDGADVVFHEAGQPGVRLSWSDGFVDYVGHNVLATQRLLEAARATRPRPGRVRVVVVGVRQRRRLPDAARPTCRGRTARTASPSSPPSTCAGCTPPTGAVPTVSLRYFTVYGPRQRPDMGMHRFIDAALRRAAAPAVRRRRAGARLHLRVRRRRGEPRGRRRRPARPGTVLNVAGGGSISVNELLALLGTHRRPRARGRAAARAARRRARDRRRRSSRRARLLGWAPDVAGGRRPGGAVRVAAARSRVGPSRRSVTAGARGPGPAGLRRPCRAVGSRSGGRCRRCAGRRRRVAACRVAARNSTSRTSASPRTRPSPAATATACAMVLRRGDQAAGRVADQRRGVRVGQVAGRGDDPRLRGLRGELGLVQRAGQRVVLRRPAAPAR